MKLWHLLLAIALLAAAGLAAVAAAVIAVSQFVASAMAASLGNAVEAVNLLIAVFSPLLVLLSIALDWHMLWSVALPQIIVYVLDGHIWRWQL